LANPWQNSAFQKNSAFLTACFHYTTQTRHAQFSIHTLRIAAQNTLDGFSTGA